MHFRNPFAFRPGPVSFWTTVIYIALLIPIIYVHETVPAAPANRSLYSGLDLTEAWTDLQSITRKFHPYNSHENDVVREIFVNRTKEILDRNKIDYNFEKLENIVPQDYSFADEVTITDAKPRAVTVFDDQVSNVTWSYNSERRIGANIGSSSPWTGQYFEGNNFYVYIHGRDDPPGDWWLSDSRVDKLSGKGGVLVNCHFDSVSTGYGATDDGIGCVSMLQLLSHFTTPGRQPKNGIVLLFNNAEEDGLLGARAFGNSPLINFCHTFVNLEGAGAGGRALLFRTSDLESAKAYGKAPHPFGSVLAADAFKMGLIKSGTDFEIWDEVYGQRGLDIAFYEPRARYHTVEDDARHASVNSIWHMLSAALASTQQLSETTGTLFNGPRSDKDKGKVQNGKQTRGVWFDMFGTAWAAFALKGLFAWSLTLLVATPLILFAITYVLIRKNKYYYFARNIKTHDDTDNDPVVLGGWRGFFRFPFAFIFAGALTMASAFLLAKFNPFIIYRCGYTIWAMTLSLFYFSLWLIMRGSSFVRPSALHRGFVLIWMFAFGWLVQVGAAVLEDRYHIASLYSTVFLQSGTFVAILISLLEQFALLKKRDFAMQLHDAHHSRDRGGRTAHHPHGGDGEQDEPEGADDENAPPDSPTETTPLRAGEQGYGSNTQTFADTYRRSVPENVDGPSPPVIGSYQPFESEQTWSGRLPTWTWFLQFLLLAPVPVFLFGNIGLVAMSALRMTGTDGSNAKMPFIAIGVMSILILLPIAPFIHRVTHHVPMFLLCVCTATLIYNLAVFPFDSDHRFKFNFQQKIDLDNGTNLISLTGVEEYVRLVIKDLPFAAGQEINCDAKTDGRPTLRDCIIDGTKIAPDPVPGKRLEDLFTFKTIQSDDKIGKFQLQALDTRLCYVTSSRPVFDFQVEGGGTRDERFGAYPSEGLENIILWRRKWDTPWNVTLDLTNNQRLSTVTDGDATTENADPWKITIACQWSDANEEINLPAFHQIIRYMPTWAIVTKKNTGLVEVRKTFTMEV